MSSRPNVSAVLLAAGFSSRMGRFKPLLPVGSVCALERAIDSFLLAGISDIRVVTGHRAAELEDLLRCKQVHTVFNASYEAGMFTSVLAGLRSLGPDVDGCFFLPADMPLVRPETIHRLHREFVEWRAKILYPVMDGRRGHPPLVTRPVIEAILADEGAGGLGAVLARHEQDAIDVAVDDDGIHLDMDTPADFDEITAHADFSKVLGTTESVCPVCLQRVFARRMAREDDVYLVKICPEHGSFRTLVWRGAPSYTSWGGATKTPSRPPVSTATTQQGCPFDCGLCPEHRQHTCCVVLDVTQRCNLSCPFCFADASGNRSDPSLEELETRMRSLLTAGGPFNLQLSGGEPTVRNDLPQIILLARSLGFDFIQLNTNGLRIAAEPEFAARLKRAGLGCVFLQFDGVTDDVYVHIRGRALLEAKLAAIRACREQELGVVLVPTLVPRVNVRQIGDILRFAVGQMPTVRAVHFQPVSYFGRFPAPPSDDDRITIPEVLREIEVQTDGEIPASCFYPPSAENAYCSFQGKVRIAAGGSIRPEAHRSASGCCGSSPQLIQLGNGDAARRSRQFVARQWAFPEAEQRVDQPGVNTDALDSFLAEQQSSLSISGMAFQDAWNLDLERLRECFLHVAGADGHLFPLCAYHLTGTDGQTLYRPGSAG